MNTDIFITSSDLLPRIEYIESQKDLKYSKAGLFNPEEIVFYDSIKDLEDLGISTTDSHTKESAYLVVERKNEINIRNVKQKKGGFLLAV